MNILRASITGWSQLLSACSYNLPWLYHPSYRTQRCTRLLSFQASNALKLCIVDMLFHLQALMYREDLKGQCDCITMGVRRSIEAASGFAPGTRQHGFSLFPIMTAEQGQNTSALRGGDSPVPGWSIVFYSSTPHIAVRSGTCCFVLQAGDQM